jgi:hypothetical protein
VKRNKGFVPPSKLAGKEGENGKNIIRRKKNLIYLGGMSPPPSPPFLPEDWGRASVELCPPQTRVSLGKGN